MAKTLHCPACKQVTGVVENPDSGEVDLEKLQSESYCSAHHPDPEHRVVDKPTVRMTVATIPVPMESQKE